MTDSILLITIGLIFGTALISIYVRRRTVDRCLKDFSEFHVTVEHKDKKRIWGQLCAYPNGLELLYRRAHQDADGHVETSFVLFFDRDLDQVQAVYRYKDELLPERRRARERDIVRTYRPGLIRRALRHLRNVVATFRDAMNQSIGAVIAHAKRSQSAPVLNEDKRLTAFSDEVLGAVGNAYEPLYERYIGRRIVVEETRGGVVIEHAGILKEYSSTWIEVLDCRVREAYAFSLAQPAQLQINHNLDFWARFSDGQLELELENRGTEPVIVEAVRVEQTARPLNATVEPGQRYRHLVTELPESVVASLAGLPESVAFLADHPLPEVSGLPDVTLSVRATREVDLLMPRKHAVMRHGAEDI